MKKQINKRLLIKKRRYVLTNFKRNHPFYFIGKASRKSLIEAIAFAVKAVHAAFELHNEMIRRTRPIPKFKPGGVVNNQVAVVGEDPFGVEFSRHDWREMIPLIDPFASDHMIDAMHYGISSMIIDRHFLQTIYGIDYSNEVSKTVALVYYKGKMINPLNYKCDFISVIKRHIAGNDNADHILYDAYIKFMHANGATPAQYNALSKPQLLLSNPHNEMKCDLDCKDDQ